MNGLANGDVNNSHKTRCRRRRSISTSIVLFCFVTQLAMDSQLGASFEQTTRTTTARRCGIMLFSIIFTREDSSVGQIVCEYCSRAYSVRRVWCGLAWPAWLTNRLTPKQSYSKQMVRQYCFAQKGEKEEEQGKSGNRYLRGSLWLLIMVFNRFFVVSFASFKDRKQSLAQG